MFVIQPKNSSWTAGASSLLWALTSSLALAMGLAGCAGEQGFPNQVPEYGHQPWPDPPLTEALHAELTETRVSLVGALERQREQACVVDSQVSKRRASQGAQSRIDYARKRAAAEAERKAMSNRDFELHQIVSYDKTSHARQNRTDTLLGWHCEPLMEDACLVTAAHAATSVAARRSLSGPRTPRAALLEVLPVYRRDLEWGFGRIDASMTRVEAVDTIKQACQEGESPLGNWVKAHVDDEREHVAELARRLGGQRPCKSVAQIYTISLATLENYVRNTKGYYLCKPASELSWPE